MTRPLTELLAALQPLITRALELELPQRAAWLAQLRVEQPSLAAEVERLVAEEALLDARGFLANGVSQALAVARPGLAGQRLGAWTLEGLLGQGGMGTVWLARRSDGRFEGTAAVKLLNLALLDPVGSERFRREGTLLARLSHPHIARLLDAGITDAGQPYLVLEHVEGERIDRYCDRARLTPEQRLHLVQEVCAAVAHAHAHLIVHRDLKPSNILVTSGGTVKLLDFSIAKLVEEGGGEASTLTDLGGRALTPEYAAPEQISGGAITTATDVYALGVLLYVLLAGRHPTGEGCRSTPEYLKGVLETEPPRLSTAVVAAEERGTSAERLRRLYAGDLDNIVAKALRKRPEERYSTIGALAEDLRRYLAHEPVSARPESWGYRSAKFIRRHRAGVAAAVVTVLALVGATAVSLAQRDEARRQRDVALAESRRRLAMSDVQSVLAGDSRGPGGRGLSVLERVELASRMLRRKYRSEPAVVIEVMSDLSTRLIDVGDMKGHRQVLDSALGLAREAHLPTHVALASCLRLHSLAYDNLFDSAGIALAEAREAAARSGGLPRDIEVECLTGEGRLRVEAGEPDSAIRLLQEAVRLTPGLSEPQALEARHLLALALRAQGRTREATRWQQMIMLELDSTGYAETEQYPIVMAHLAGSLAELGEFRLLDSIAGIYVRRLESAHGQGAVDASVATVYGFNKLRKGELDSAAVWLAAALRDSSETARLVASMWIPPARAQLLVEQGRIEEARRIVVGLPLDTRGRRMTKALLGARLRRADGDLAGARTALDSALTADSAATKPAPHMIYALLLAAEWRLADGEPDAADSLARLALEAATLDSLTLRRSAHVGRAELVRARVAAQLGDSLQAIRAAEASRLALERGFGPDHPLAREARTLRRRFRPEG